MLDATRRIARYRSAAELVRPEALAHKQRSNRRPGLHFVRRGMPLRATVSPPSRECPAVSGSRAMELAGLEPATSWVRSRRSPN